MADGAGATVGHAEGDDALAALDDAVHRALLSGGDGADTDPLTGDRRAAVERLVGTVAPLLGPDDVAGVVGRGLAPGEGLCPPAALLGVPSVYAAMGNSAGPAGVAAACGTGGAAGRPRSSSRTCRRS